MMWVDGSAISSETCTLSVGRPITRVAISSLLPADSPRLAGEDAEHTRVLAQVCARLPPIVVQRSNMRVVDGMHRLRAAVWRGESEIDVVFFNGDDKESFIFAVKANIVHGLPLSLADRTAAAKRIVKSYPLWSDRVIGGASGLDAKTIAALRQSDPTAPRVEVRIGRDGRVRPVDAAEGRRRVSELLKGDPGSSLRRVARAAGVSLGTAADVRRRIQSGQDPVPSRRRSADASQGRLAGSNGQRGSAVTNASGQDPRILLLRLRQDPSLRFSQAGRALLRRLEIQTMRGDEREQLLNSVPAHCTETVMELARECSRFWKEFSLQLEERRQVSA